MHRITARLFAVALALSPLAAPVADAGSKQEVRAAKKAFNDDKRDYKQLSRIVDKWDRARAAKKDGLESRMDEKLAKWLREEIAEDRATMRDARADLTAAGGDPRAITQEREHPTRRDRRDRAEVPAHARAELRQAKQAQADLRATREIARELRAIQPRFDSGRAGPNLYDQKAALLDQLLVAAGRDAKQANRRYQQAKRAR